MRLRHGCIRRFVKENLFPRKSTGDICKKLLDLFRLDQASLSPIRSVDVKRTPRTSNESSISADLSKPPRKVATKGFTPDGSSQSSSSSSKKSPSTPNLEDESSEVNYFDEDPVISNLKDREEANNELKSSLTKRSHSAIIGLITSSTWTLCQTSN